MKKQEIWIGVWPRYVSEIEPPAQDGRLYNHSERQHRWRHPDVDIRLIAPDQLRTAGRFDEIQQAVMLALQANGFSVAALRYVAPEKRRRKKKVAVTGDGKRQMSMFGENDS